MRLQLAITHACQPVSDEDIWAFANSFFRCFLWLKDTSYSKVSEEVNRKLRAMNPLLQLLTLYTAPERHNTYRHRRTDRQTDRRQDDASSCS